MAKIGDAPHPGILLDGYAKTVITLASAVLAISVTVFNTAGVKSHSAFAVTLFVLQWIVLFVTLACAIGVIASLAKASQKSLLAARKGEEFNSTPATDTTTRDRLQEEKRRAEQSAETGYRTGLKCCWGSFISFGVSGLLLVSTTTLLAVLSSPMHHTAPNAADASVKYITDTYKISLNPTDLQSLSYDTRKKEYNVIIIHQGATYEVRVAATDLQVLHHKKT